MENNDIIQSRQEQWREDLRKGKSAKDRIKTPRVKMPELSPAYLHLRVSQQNVVDHRTL